MQHLSYRFPAAQAATRAVHVGVVASGDLEILLEPPADERSGHAQVVVRTSVDGFDTIWREVLQRFFDRQSLSGTWQLNDFGATPGVVTLRLRQTVEAAVDESEPS